MPSNSTPIRLRNMARRDPVLVRSAARPDVLDLVELDRPGLPLTIFTSRR